MKNVIKVANCNNTFAIQLYKLENNTTFTAPRLFQRNEDILPKVLFITFPYILSTNYSYLLKR